MVAEPFPKALKGKRVIVTGGTSGIGAETVRQLLTRGAHVAFCGLTEDGAAPLQALAASANTPSYFEAFDLSDQSRTRAFARAAITHLGGLDGLVSNAGTNFFRGVAGSTRSDLEACFALNFYPAWALA